MEYGEEFDPCDVGGGPLVRSLIYDVHDKANARLEEVLTRTFMEADVSKKTWHKSTMKRIKEMLKLVGAPNRSRLKGDGAVDATKLLSRMPWIKLRFTESDNPKKYPDGTSVGVNADPHLLIKAWLWQYRHELDGMFFHLDEEGNNITGKVEGASVRVVLIVDANVVGENSNLGNDNGVFHTTAVVIKVIFWKGQDRVHDIILGVLYSGNDHYLEFMDHAKSWCDEVYNLSGIEFNADDDGVTQSFTLPFVCVAMLPDGAGGLRELLGAFSIGRYTLFDSPFHSLPNLLRFFPKYADKYGRPVFSSPTTGGSEYRNLFHECAREVGVKTCGIKFNYKRPPLLPQLLTAVLNGLFHMGTGMAKWFAARICEWITDGGVDTVTAFIAHCRTCLGFYFK